MKSDQPNSPIDSTRAVTQTLLRTTSNVNLVADCQLSSIVEVSDEEALISRSHSEGEIGFGKRSPKEFESMSTSSYNIALERHASWEEKSVTSRKGDSPTPSTVSVSNTQSGITTTSVVASSSLTIDCCNSNSVDDTSCLSIASSGVFDELESVCSSSTTNTNFTPRAASIHGSINDLGSIDSSGKLSISGSSSEKIHRQPPGATYDQIPRFFSPKQFGEDIVRSVNVSTFTENHLAEQSLSLIPANILHGINQHFRMYYAVCVTLKDVENKNQRLVEKFMRSCAASPHLYSIPSEFIYEVMMLAVANIVIPIDALSRLAREVLQMPSFVNLLLHRRIQELYQNECDDGINELSLRRSSSMNNSAAFVISYKAFLYYYLYEVLPFPKPEERLFRLLASYSTTIQRTQMNGMFRGFSATPSNELYLTPGDFLPLLQEVTFTLPSLSFLTQNASGTTSVSNDQLDGGNHQSNEFIDKYIVTVLTRIFYHLNVSRTGKISFREFVSLPSMETNTMQHQTSLYRVLMALDRDVQLADGSPIDSHHREVPINHDDEEFFSYEHFYVLYCLFYQLDEDGDNLITSEDIFHRYQHGALSSLIIER